MADMMRGMGGLGKMGASAEKKPKPEAMKADPAKDTKGKTDGEQGDKTTITHNADGTHTSEHGGETTDHPDHLHMLAHIGHQVTGGDKHHVTHHDGMSMHSHGISEDGEHSETKDSGSPEEAGQDCANCMADGEDEGGEHPDGEEAHQMEPAYGGMMG